MKPAIGVLLLSFITTITAGFVVYQFASSFTERMKTVFPAQSLQLESVYINNTCMTVYVRSLASVDIQITEAYVDDDPHDLRENVIISPGSVGIIHLYGAYSVGEAYSVKIIPSLGSPIVLNKKYD